MPAIDSGRWGWLVVVGMLLLPGRVSASVEVTGIVRANGEPYSAKRVRFQALSGPSSGETRTDEFGEYRLTLQEAGEYIVVLGSGGVTRRVRLVAGANRVDLDISGATIAVEVEGTTAKVSVELQAKGSLSTHSLEPGGSHVWEGLKFGDYLVSVRPRGSVSATERVTLSPTNPSASVRLRLEPNRGELLIVDRNGHLVPGVAFPWLSQRPLELSPGRFQLETVPPGTPLRIQPPNGLTPTCHIVRANQIKEVGVVPGQQATIVFEGIQAYQLGDDLGHVEGIEGSECGVPLRSFGVLNISSAENRLTIELANFPAVGEVRLSTTLGWRNVALDQNRVAHLRFNPRH